MRLQLIRHATLWLEYAGVTFLIDPMFSDAGVNPPIPGSGNDRRNPLVPLPSPIGDWLGADVLLVTHLHKDHWDDAAAAALPKSTPVLCQPGDQTAFASAGFTSVKEIISSLLFQDVTIIRTGGQHGTGEIGRKMGQVSGFVFKAEGEPALYIAGDTIWCEDVKQALDSHQPDVTVLNSGGARFTIGDSITMDESDVINVCRYAPYTKVVAVHMDTINHCVVTRKDLHGRLAKEGLLAQTVIPGDGDWV